ncbi:DUF981 family protein [Nocardia grenadensis]|uniref:DUF981 family protein n=1 Tax=Nocardia grenadensis TaxID=931537 RepID=UPI000A021474|nr:DUF981 family protein [Nocardia grenadensis]
MLSTTAVRSTLLAAPEEFPWDRFQMYNTLMGISAGVSLLLVVSLGRKILEGKPSDFDGYALALGINGALLTFLGGHMTVEWPFSVVPQANIVFGEGSLALGVLLLAAAFYLWKIRSRAGGEDIASLFTTMRPVSYLVAAVGAGMAAIGVAGIKYQLFGAPPEEPITGRFADSPMVESVFISTLFFLIAAGAVLTPAFTKNSNRVVGLVIAICWCLSGTAWIVFSVLNYFTHIGLIMNTS